MVGFWTFSFTLAISIGYRLNDVTLMFTAIHAWIALLANTIYYNCFNMEYIGRNIFYENLHSDNWEFSSFHDLKNIRGDSPDSLDSYNLPTFLQEIN